MTDLLIGGTVWWAIPAVALAFGAVFGFFPGFVLRLLVLLYPADDPRRKELVAELYMLGRMERVEWVFQQLETALFEGVSARREQRRSERSDGPTNEADCDPAARSTELPENEGSDAATRDDALAHTSSHGLTDDWIKFFDEEDVHSVIRTAPATLLRLTDPQYARYAIPALRRAIDSYGDEVVRRKDGVE